MTVRALTVGGDVIPSAEVISAPSITIGRTSPLRQADPPTCSITLIGIRDVRPGERVLLTVGGQTRFQGVVDDSQVDGISGLTKITATSDVSTLAHHKLSGVWPSESFLARMVRLYGLWQQHNLTLFTPSDRAWPMDALDVDGKSVLDVTQMHAQGLGMSLDIGRDGVSGITARDRDMPALRDVVIPDANLTRVEWADGQELRILGIEMRNAVARREYGSPLTHSIETPLTVGSAWDEIANRALARWGNAIWHPTVSVRASGALETELREISAGSSTVTINVAARPGDRGASRWLVEGWTEHWGEKASLFEMLLAPMSRAGWIGRTWADWDTETWAQIEAKTWITSEIGDK